MEGFKKYEKIISWIIIIFILGIFAYSIGSTARANKYRGLCNQYTEQLRAAEERNREFEDRFGRIQEVVGRLSETANSNVTGARDIIETVERLRAEVQELEDCCGRDSQREYYQYWDAHFGIE
jgi:uncharacterized protein YukE